MKMYTTELGHMTKMAAMPIYGKNLKKSSSALESLRENTPIGMKIYTIEVGHMTKMAAMPISALESLRENTPIGMKIYTIEVGHMTKMAAMPIYGKNLKKCSNYDNGLTLTHFMPRSNLVT